jgi:serine/threonine protein kinase
MIIDGDSRLSNYVLVDQIGSGAYSTVWLGKNVVTNTNVAIKIIDAALVTTTDAMTRFNREVALLKQLNHPFIASFFEMIQTDNAYFLIMEHAPDGTLQDYIKANGQIAESKAKKFFAQLLSVLDYLHNVKHIAHRDLKPANILLDRNSNIRVIDFGFSKQFTTETPEFHTTCGSPAYIAPEVIRGKAYTQAADIWSAGILLYTMVVGHNPHQANDVKTLLKKVVCEEIAYPSFLSTGLQSLLKKMLQQNPAERARLETIKADPWLAQFCYDEIDCSVRLRDASGSLDEMIVDKMNSLGVDCQTLSQELNSGEFTPLTAIYRELQKEEDHFIPTPKRAAESPKRFTFAPVAIAAPNRRRHMSMTPDMCPGPHPVRRCAGPTVIAGPGGARAPVLRRV